MLAVLSPAKSLDYESPLTTSRFSDPQLMHESALLIEQLRQFTPADIASLMSLSDKLAFLAYDVYVRSRHRDSGSGNTICTIGKISECSI